MANDIGGLPWQIDTPSATTVKAGLVYVKGIAFSSYASAVDQAIITGLDGSGNTIVVATLQGTSDLSLVKVDVGMPFWVRNLTVATLTSGRVSVYV